MKEQWIDAKELKIIPFDSVNGIQFGINRKELWDKV